MDFNTCRRTGPSFRPALVLALLLGCSGPPAEPVAPGGEGDVGPARSAVSAPVCTSLRREGGEGVVWDAQVVSSRPDTNYGASPTIGAGFSGATERRALFRFDISAIPAGPDTNITAGLLNLAVATAPGGLATLEVHRVTSPWDEAAVTWSSFGGASEPAVTATLNIGSPNPSADIQALLADWVHGSAPNHGVVLVQPDAVFTTFFASEDTVPARRPSLSLCYTITCHAGFADCNADGTDGCETDTMISVDHCGACGDACALPHATAACAGGACAVASCDGVFADCNANPTDGCETDVLTSVDHCGACSHVCALPNAAAACAGGACAVASCEAGFADCNGDPADGCETPLDTTTDCGGCGHVCALPNAAASCSTGACHLTTCVPGFFDCDNDPATGCEPFPCAAGSLCADDTWCSSGVCAAGLCAAPTCSDGVHNHGEVGVDCGGPCGNYVKKVAASDNHSLVLEVGGTLWATGRNDHGQLGDGATIDRSAYVQVLTGVADVAAGAEHTVAVKTDGTLWATGRNDHGQLGDGTTTDRSSYVQVPSFFGAVSVAAGQAHTLVVRADGDTQSLWAVGRNDSSQLGDGSNGDRSTYVQVLGDVASAAGGNSRSVALKTDGTLWATGSFACYQHCEYNCDALGALLCYQACYQYYCCNPMTGYTGGPLCEASCLVACCPQTCSTVCPTFDHVLSDVASVAAGVDHTLAVKTDGTLWATGDNTHGQLGDGTKTSRSDYVQVLDDVAMAAGGQGHSLAVKTDGTLWATGDNYYGQLGAGSTHGLVSFAWLPELAAVTGVAAGAYHTLAVEADGTLWATGYNNEGQLGDGSKLDQATFAAVEIPSCPRE